MVPASLRALMRFFLPLVLVFATWAASSLEAKSIRSPVCVSISEIAQIGRDLSFHLSGQSPRKSAPEITLKNKDRAQEVREWYELVRVSRQAVLLQLNF